jgi:hypothetical protein
MGPAAIHKGEVPRNSVAAVQNYENLLQSHDELEKVCIILLGSGEA